MPGVQHGRIDNRCGSAVPPARDGSTTVRRCRTGAAGFHALPTTPESVTRNETVSAGLWTAIDGHDVGRGFGRDCPSCDREHEPGDRLVVTLERTSETTAWGVPSVVCSECGRRSIPEEDRRAGVEQVLVSVELTAAPMALVLDGESARLLDRSPTTGG